ncbi:CWF19-like protein 2 [Clavelina lepadiformis]|uniref:CWF19-like protein 2 n=1 Tax=Clavelina lepadiformis TaxID=159417 RepID=UPI004041C4D5
MDVETKKKKHHKKNHREESRSSNESDQDEWVEKGNPLPKEQWMQEDFLSGIRTISSKEAKEQAKAKTEANIPSLKSLQTIDQMGQHKKELNPYWKMGGDGLPSEMQETKKPEMIPDLSWLQSSLRRMQEQSKESGRGIESIAAERYGSWKAFQQLLDKAETKAGKSSSRRREESERRRSSGRRFMKPSDDYKPQERYHSRSGRDMRRNTSSKSWKKPLQQSVKGDPPEKVGHQKNEDQNFPTNKPSQVLELVPCADEGKKAKQDQPTVVSPDTNKVKILSEQEKNVIGAKIIRAEMMSNDKLVKKLKKKLELSKEAEAVMKSGNVDKSESGYKRVNSDSGDSDEDGAIILTRMTKSGQEWPITESEMPLSSKMAKKLKHKKVKVHDEEGQREKYFADDDRYTLKDLVERERNGLAEDQTETLSRLSSKLFRKTDGDNFTLDDMFESQAGKVNCKAQEEEKNRRRAISEQKKLMRRLEKCKHCFGNRENPKHLIIAIGRVSYLKLPSHRALQPGHCIIAPMHHCATGTSLDEDVWEEIRQFMRALCRMFMEEDEDCVFLQTCMGLKHSPHFFIECIPMPKEIGDLAPIYFKKAIQECEGEWAQNKALIDTRGRSVKGKVPVGLPYFAVDFGMDGGFAHVIEDEIRFPSYFGREIVGGMLSAEPLLWRKPKEEELGEQTKRTLQFESRFKKFDFSSPTE